MNCHQNAEAIEIRVTKIKGTDKQIVNEQVALEKALTVYLNDREFMTMVCSPGQER